MDDIGIHAREGFDGLGNEVGRDVSGGAEGAPLALRFPRESVAIENPLVEARWWVLGEGSV
jgi:hypothetical protein